MTKAKIIASILLIAMMVHFSIIIMHMEHECTNYDNCPICILIHKYKINLNEFNSSLTKILTIVFLLVSNLILGLLNKVINKKQYTPVELNVELIN